MAGQVKIPGIGPVNKNVAIGSGIGLGVLVLLYYYRKNSAAQQAANAASQTAANTTAAADSGSGIDPQTGYPYGSPEDQAALAAQSWNMLPTYTGGGYNGGGSGGGGNGPGPGGFTNNAQWAQAAEQLMGSSGADTIAAALGKYLTGQPVTADMQTIIQQAIAIEGYPPVPGPNGFPPSIDLQSGGGGKTIGGYQAFAPGGKSLAQLAAPPYAPAGITAAELEKMNPGVFKKYGSKPLPAGTGYYIPKETVTAA